MLSGEYKMEALTGNKLQNVERKCGKLPLELFCKNCVLKNFAKFKENNCVGISFAGLQACIFKERLQNNSFSEKLAKFLRTPILKKICEKLFQ